MTPTITLGGLTIGPEVAGGSIVYSEIRGWHSGAGSRVELLSRPAADGAFDAGRILREPRVVTLRGWVYGDTRAEVAARLLELTGLFGDGRAVSFAMSDPDYGLLSARVHLSGGTEPDVEWDTPTAARWALSLTAADPRKYGAEQVASVGLPTRGSATGLVYPLAFPVDYGVTSGASAGELLLGNPGRVAYHPRLRIDGPVTNPRVWMVETGAEIRLGMTVPAGQWVDLLLRDRRVLLQGVASRRFAVTYQGDWLAVPPGGGTLRWEADSFDEAAQLWAWAPDGAWL